MTFTFCTSLTLLLKLSIAQFTAAYAAVVRHSAIQSQSRPITDIDRWHSGNRNCGEWNERSANQENVETIWHCSRRRNYISDLFHHWSSWTMSMTFVWNSRETFSLHVFTNIRHLTSHFPWLHKIVNSLMSRAHWCHRIVSSFVTSVSHHHYFHAFSENSHWTLCLPFSRQFASTLEPLNSCKARNDWRRTDGGETTLEEMCVFYIRIKTQWRYCIPFTF